MLRHVGREPAEATDRLTKARRSQLDRDLRDYLLHGGFPEAQELDDPATLAREVRALQEAKTEFPGARCQLIALDMPSALSVPEGIEIARAVDWLLAMP